MESLVRRLFVGTRHHPLSMRESRPACLSNALGLNPTPIFIELDYTTNIAIFVGNTSSRSPRRTGASRYDP